LQNDAQKVKRACLGFMNITYVPNQRDTKPALVLGYRGRTWVADMSKNVAEEGGGKMQDMETDWLKRWWKTLSNQRRRSSDDGYFELVDNKASVMFSTEKDRLSKADVVPEHVDDWHQTF
jgi:hypothetical protein